MGIVNSRPLVPVSTDPECPYNLTPNTLLTQKLPILFEDQIPVDARDSLSIQWRRVQHLSNTFWTRWKKEYLPILQPRNKWQQGKQNIKVGDIVHMQDTALHRNEWPMGIVTKCYPGSDSFVRKVDVKLGLTQKIMSRPIHEIILVLPQPELPKLSTTQPHNTEPEKDCFSSTSDMDPMPPNGGEDPSTISLQGGESAKVSSTKGLNSKCVSTLPTHSHVTQPLAPADLEYNRNPGNLDLQRVVNHKGDRSSPTPVKPVFSDRLGFHGRKRERIKAMFDKTGYVATPPSLFSIHVNSPSWRN